MRTTILLSLILLVALSGCKKIDKLTQFELEFDNTVIIESATGIDLPFNTLQPGIETNSTATFAANDTRKDMIEEIKLTQLDLTLSSPKNGNFDFLESIELFIKAEGLEERQIAWMDEIPQGAGTRLDLNVSGANIMEYIKKDNFDLRVSVVTDETIQSDHQIEIHSVFFVDAKVLGQCLPRHQFPFIRSIIS